MWIKGLVVMRLNYVLVFAVTGLLSSVSGYADDAFVPEKMTVESKIKPGPNAFVLEQNWAGVSRVDVMSADDFSNKGNMSVGIIAQFALSKDHKTAYTVSSYAKRIISGPTEAVLQEFDVDTLSVKREVIVSPKLIQSNAQSSYLQLSADEHYAYVQNATPATSVTVVDLKTGNILVEVPTPGCFGIYPALQGRRFSSLCGDGAITSYTFNEDGSLAKPAKSAKVFDVDKEPLFIHGVRVEKDLLFTSFNGNVYRVADAAETPKLIEKFSITEGVEGKWAPGGAALTAYNPAHKVLFVSMHPDAEEGSHKVAGSEVWAINMITKKVMYRSVVDGALSLAVTHGDKPVLYTLNVDSSTVSRYEVDPAAKFAAKLTSKKDTLGKYPYYPLLVWVDE